MDTKKVDYSHQEYLSDDKVGTPPISDHDVPSFVNGRPVQIMTAEEKHAALEQAQLEDPGVPYSDPRFIWYILTVLCVCLCGGDSGLDATVMSSVNSMTQYKKYFGIGANDTAAARTGIVFGMYTIGGVVGFIPSSTMPDLIGRKWTMVSANVVLTVGALLTANARNMGMFLAGRFLTGLGCTTAAAAAKSYMAEITNPKRRGLYMGTLNSFYYIGQILASGITIPTGRYANDWSWRAPLYVQGLPAMINAIGMIFAEESPRWLYAHGKREQALRILAKFHSRDNDINSPMVKIQVAEIEEAISLTGSDKRWWDFSRLVATSASRYRLFCAFLLSIYGQLAGNGLITYFLPTLLGLAGITSPDRQRVLNFVNSVTSMFGAATGTVIVDRVGRRKLMLFALMSCVGWLTLVTILLSPVGNESNSRASAGIASIYLFMVFFSLGITPLQGLYPAEVFSYENRAKGLAMQGLLTNGVSCINTFALPTALLKLGWKTYIIFAIFDFVGIFVVWFTMVETRRLTLEEIDAVFLQGNARKRSIELAKHKSKAAQDSS